MDKMVLYNIESYPQDRAAIAYVSVNDKPMQIHMREINKEWLITDLWWPMHQLITPIVAQAAKVAILFGATRFDFKLVGIKRYLMLGYPEFVVADQDVRGIFN
jgi:hypothetical protein